MSALAIQGTSSWAGKSLLTTALARLFARRGVRVAPFKAQNMSNNARVVDGGEIGVAQYLQALAARVEPDVRMNPALVKPEGDTRSQVVVLGRADAGLSGTPWRGRAPSLWPAIEESLRSLLAEYELVLLEGAGSPAEINLRGSDLANMPAARAAGARVILVADIDRGGAFAGLYGTWALLPEDERARLGAFVLNRFRGDAALLAPGPQQLAALTGMAPAGVVPLLAHGLPDEDGAAEPRVLGGRPRVAVVRYPTASNLDELKLLEQVADVVWARHPADLVRADLVVLPGSKHVPGDRAWLDATGLGDAVVARAGAGGRILGICGGLQLLGDDGLGVLRVRTAYAEEKLVRRVESRFGELPEPWAALSGRPVRGYEIRHGSTAGPAAAALPDGLGFVAGSVLAVSVHGLLEDPDLVEALPGVRPTRTLDAALDDLADAVGEHLDLPLLERLAG